MTLRGRNASRIRQVVQQGRQIEGGDPLFNLKPVWMTSPETVAQIFPLEPIFDLVIFDEASQCRLEHGLPVLARGHRVCVAGDTKQLPPTRFFDTAVMASGEAEESDDGPESLFVSQQSEIEDLLSAALNIEVEQSYLDVHYRSSSEDLICFSNDSFYGSRLQAIPGHPNNRREEPPVRLHQVNGVYADRQNQAEAEYVVNLIKGLLRRADPPSIGVVTFNLQQKDLITRALDTAAEEDAAFRQALAAARARQGDSSFEGLFVKNLENVQGDERDWIIISTTYGPDAQGRFYRRFGPLGQTGGERRLNVIITRAREQVELVTSIPAEVYRAPVEVPEGKRPNGGWYLMGYLRYAEELADLYARAREEHQAEEAAEAGLPATVTPAGPVVPVRMADALAARLASARGTSSWLYYGTEGFYVDVAFRHPVRTKNATVGVLCDATRYPRAQDPVEWDCFQTLVLESQNWKLHRLWTPHFFRDPEGALERLHRELGEMEMISGQDGETAIRNP